MPELPEVETIRRQLEPLVSGAVIVDADAHPSAKFTPALDAVGTAIEGIARRGKYLLFSLDDGRELVAHLGMTGSFRVVDTVEMVDAPGEGIRCADHDPYVRAAWRFDDDRALVFRDVRRFGRLHVVDRGDYEAITTLHHMGPEPLGPDFDGASLHAAVSRSSRAIKTQLLSQRPVAGVGNIYADEALHLARVNPRAKRVGRDRCDRLATAIVSVLQAGIDNGGTTLRDYVDADGDQGQNQHSLVAYGRGGEPCLTCGQLLTSIVLDARTTTYCRTCQRR